jgi:hypothetical protein
LLEPAIAESNGRWKAEYVFAGLVAGQQHLWVILDADDIVAAFVTEFTHYPERKLICIHFLGGQGFDDWYPDMLREVTEFAKTAGCDGIECNARFGFWKWFQHDGFIRKSCFYEKKL